MRLAEGIGGDDEFVQGLIDQFVADAPGLLSAARAGLEAGDADVVRRAAHTLKSNAATFGARRLAECSRELEEDAKKNALAEAPARVDAMARELERVRAELPVVWLEMSKNVLT
jgi:HPt (histidine-containing phosphotransfer) domain-containing protein